MRKIALTRVMKRLLIRRASDEMVTIMKSIKFLGSIMMDGIKAITDGLNPRRSKNVAVRRAVEMIMSSLHVRRRAPIIDCDYSLTNQNENMKRYHHLKYKDHEDAT